MAEASTHSDEGGNPTSDEDEEDEHRCGIPSIPSEHHYLKEVGFAEVTSFGDFTDANLSGAAAGFITYRPITMLLRGWPFRFFIIAWALYWSINAVMYAIGSNEIEVEHPAFDLKPLAIVSSAIPAGLLWMVPLLAAHGYARLGTVFIAGAAASVGLISIYLWVATSLLEKMWLFALWSSVVVFAQLSIAFVIAFREHWIHLTLLFNSGLLFITALLLLPSFGMAVGFDLAAVTLVLLLEVGLRCWRFHSLVQVRKEAKMDHAHYDEVWEPVRRTREGELRKLSEVASSVVSTRAMQPYKTMEEIFKCGYALDAWYQRVVEDWARLCGVRSLRAPVKSVQRALEKIQRSYHGRAALVCDIVRASIIVEQIDHAQPVLEYVMHHSTVYSVKNRFDLNYNAAVTAGYRDLNVHFTFKELVGTAFEGFIFELQIHYAPILARKSSAGHARYIKLRNLRGD